MPQAPNFLTPEEYGLFLKLPAKNGGFSAYSPPATCGVQITQNGVSPLPCKRELNIGLFFDGTNNNRDRDIKDNSHSNIVKLYYAHIDQPKKGFFSIYVPGVGTPFPNVGEYEESDDGKGFGRGGQIRIAWGLAALLNCIRQTYENRDLITDSEIRGKFYTFKESTAGLLYSWATDDHQAFFNNKLRDLYKIHLNSQLRITQVNISIFGFSRGAAQARACANWLDACIRFSDNAFGNYDGHHNIAGMPVNVKFLGIFDTVASVGLANSFPGPFRGLQGYASAALDIPETVNKCVHMVAAHEIRASFPVSTARNGKAYPANTTEYVYPGAHSDVGGGYGPGSQGRSNDGVASLLAVIPLLNMYTEARKAGVPLRDVGQMLKEHKGDFQLDPKLMNAFNAYLTYSQIKGGAVDLQLDAHMRLYRRYKWQVLGTTRDYQNAHNPQDVQDLKESQADFNKDIDRRRSEDRKAIVSSMTYNPLLPIKPPNDVAALEARNDKDLTDYKRPLPKEILEFFVNYVHDSHAGFSLAGPVTEFDKKEEIARVSQRVIDIANQYGSYYPDVTTHLDKFLSTWEYKVYSSSSFPVMTDADTLELLEAKHNFATSEALIPNMYGRREGNAYFYRRVVFDGSGWFGDQSSVRTAG